MKLSTLSLIALASVFAFGSLTAQADGTSKPPKIVDRGMIGGSSILLQMGSDVLVVCDLDSMSSVSYHASSGKDVEDAEVSFVAMDQACLSSVTWKTVHKEWIKSHEHFGLLSFEERARTCEKVYKDPTNPIWLVTGLDEICTQRALQWLQFNPSVCLEETAHYRAEAWQNSRVAQDLERLGYGKVAKRFSEDANRFLGAVKHAKADTPACVTDAGQKQSKETAAPLAGSAVAVAGAATASAAGEAR